MREHLIPEPYIERRARDVCAVCAHNHDLWRRLNKKILDPPLNKAPWK